MKSTLYERMEREMDRKGRVFILENITHISRNRLKMQYKAMKRQTRNGTALLIANTIKYMVWEGMCIHTESFVVKLREFGVLSNHEVKLNGLPTCRFKQGLME